MTPPTIHLNGTSGRELFAGYEAAHAAVKQAQEIFGKIEFNPRDYYVQNEHAWTKARQGRLEQWKALAQVEEYLEHHLMAIQDQIDLQEKRKAALYEAAVASYPNLKLNP